MRSLLALVPVALFPTAALADTVDDALDAMLAAANAAHPGAPLQEDAARASLRPSTLEDQLRALSDAAAANGCTLDGGGWVAGAFTGSALTGSHDSGAITNGVRTPGSFLFDLGGTPLAIGGSFSDHTSSKALARRNDVNGFAAGIVVRTQGRRGIFLGFHDRCEGAADALDAWYDGDTSDWPAPAASTLSVSSTPPVEDGNDIAMLDTTTTFDAGGDHGHVWHNRPTQGQSFLSGSAPYSLVYSVTLRNRFDTVTDNNATWTVRIGTLDGSAITPEVTATSNNLISYVPGDYLTFTFGEPVLLRADTDYGFDWATTGAGFVTDNASNDLYAYGGAFRHGDNGVGNDDALQFPDADRIFHIDIE